MIGLFGSHRSGKTTLAIAYAKKHGVSYVKTTASEVFESMGLDPARRYDFPTRLSVQEEILRRFDKIYSEHKVGMRAIADRTPIDLLAYTIADIASDTVSEESQKRLDQYTQDCFDVLNKRFSVVMLIQPGIPLVDEPGKAAMSRAYMEHLNFLMLGLSVSEKIKVAHFYNPRSYLEPEDRIAALENAVKRAVGIASEELALAVLHEGVRAVH